MEEHEGRHGRRGLRGRLMHAWLVAKQRSMRSAAIGLVENMPDGNAQRPGDIVTSMSGQTIESSTPTPKPARPGRRALVRDEEVQAEIHGRSCDAYRRDHGRARNDMLACSPTTTNWRTAEQDRTETGERVWRMPLGPEYDKQIDSQFAT